MQLNVFIVGEDPVTRAIIYRLVKDYAPGIRIIQSLPARGGEIKSKIVSFNHLALSYPIILLSDLDTEPCPPIAKTNLLKGVTEVAPDFIINIAVDEAEAWLFADREGFANFFGVPIESVPKSVLKKLQGIKPRIEMEVPIKSSYYLTHNLIGLSSNDTLKNQISSSSSCKGKEYNSALLPFISSFWNPEEARKNAYSLDRMIQRIERLVKS